MAAHATILAVVLWAAAAINLANPGPRLLSGQIKGTDFLHFYDLGRAVVTGAPSWVLYDAVGLHNLQIRAVPESEREWYPPVYGPQAALLFAPFAAASYIAAGRAWAISSIVLYVLSISLAWRGTRHLHARRRLVWTAAAAFPPFYHLIMHGQTTAVILMAFVAAWLALGRGRPFVAGLALGVVALKPQLGIVTAAVVLLSGESSIIAGAVASVICQVGVVWSVLGSDVFVYYLSTLQQLPQIDVLLDIRQAQVHSVRGFLALLLPAALVKPLWIVATVVIIAAMLRLWKAALPLELRFSGLLVATVLASPHLYIYDVVLLAPALLWWADWQVSRGPMHCLTLLYWLFVALLIPVALIVPLQVSVILLVVLGWSLFTAAHDVANQDAGRLRLA